MTYLTEKVKNKWFTVTAKYEFVYRYTVSINQLFTGYESPTWPR